MPGIGSSKRFTAAARAGVLLRIGTLLAMVAGLVVGTAAWADAATGLDVYVGYMDTHTVATSSQQPNPWPYTDASRYVGTPCPSFGSTNACWDASALRLVNNGSADVTGVHVVVTMGTHRLRPVGQPHRAGERRPGAHRDRVVAELGELRRLGLRTQRLQRRPAVLVHQLGGQAGGDRDHRGHHHAYSDSGQVLNAGGVDGGHCVDGVFVAGRLDESHPWVMIGTAPAGGGGGGTTATAPSAPTNLKATAGDASVKLSWSAPASDGGSGITGYRVLRGTTPGGESATPVATVTSTSYTDTGLTNGSRYYFKVVAVNAVGPSAASSEAVRDAAGRNARAHRTRGTDEPEGHGR